MILPVCGMDPSLANWGMAEGRFNLATGFLDDVVLTVASTKKNKSKQIRTNSDDLQRAHDLATSVFEVGMRNKVIFVECPVGSQSADGMKAYGIVIGVLGSLRANGIQIIEVTAAEVKKSLSGNPLATKAEMIKAGVSHYPQANWPLYRGRINSGIAEHMADSLGAIHAGVNTPVFQNVMRIFAEVN